MNEQLRMPGLALCEIVFDVCYDRTGTFIRSCCLPAGHDGTCIPSWEHAGGPSPEYARVDQRWL